MLSRAKNDVWIAQNPLHTFPRNFPVDGEAANLLRTCCGHVSDTANKSATSLQQVVVMEFGKRHDTTDTTDFCPRQRVYRLVTELLYWETGVMDFGLYTSSPSSSASSILSYDEHWLTTLRIYWRNNHAGARSLVSGGRWSHMASDVPWVWDGVPMKSYIGHLSAFFTFIPIRLETTESLGFMKRLPQQEKE